MVNKTFEIHSNERFKIKEDYDGIVIIDTDYNNTYSLDGNGIREIVGVLNELDVFVKVFRRR